MREVLYLSEQKLQNMFLDARRLPGLADHSIDTSIGFFGANAKVSLNSPDQSNQQNTDSLITKLERVIRYLDRTHRAVDFPHSGLTPNQWIRFDFKALYGKAYEDAAPSFAPADIVLFGGSTAYDSKTAEQEVSLLLCGSVHHLRDQVVATGRMGSSTSWLHDFIRSNEEKERKSIDVIPEFPESRIQSKRNEFDLRMAAYEAFGGLMRSSYPAPDSGRVRGHAKVLLDIEDPRWTTRLVVATPLYVEIPPIKRKRGMWRRFKRRRT